MNILNIAGASLGYTHLSDSKLKMSVSKKGNRNIIFHKKHTEETRKSICLKMKGRLGRLHTDITRTKISESLRGKSTSKEARDNISAACKGIIYTEETKAKLRIAMINKKPSIRTREKMKIRHSKPILVTNVLNCETCLYPSIKQGGLELNTTSTKIRRYIKNKSVIFDLYLITVPSEG